MNTLSKMFKKVVHFFIVCILLLQLSVALICLMGYRVFIAAVDFVLDELDKFFTLAPNYYPPNNKFENQIVYWADNSLIFWYGVGVVLGMFIVLIWGDTVTNVFS